jgi:hypothetical protein
LNIRDFENESWFILQYQVPFHQSIISINKQILSKNMDKIEGIIVKFD